MSGSIFQFPPAASTLAAQVDLFYFFLVALSLVLSVGIAVVLFAFALRFRRREGNTVGADIHGSNVLETVWSAIPFGIAMFIFAWGASLYIDLSRPPDDAMEVFVVGKQWMWKVQHMEGRREINQLHVPTGRPVKLTMTSEDVIHSFFVPAFRVKADVVPGRYNTVWFEATEVGTYHLFCAEYCGTEHSRMIGSVVVMEPTAYQEWLARGNDDGDAATSLANLSPVERGEALFDAQGCRTCHIDGPGGIGPRLAGLHGREVKLRDGRETVADDQYLRKSILNPGAEIVKGYQAVMPTFAGRLDEEELLSLLAYIKSLGRGGESAPAHDDAADDALDGAPAAADTDAQAATDAPAGATGG